MTETQIPAFGRALRQFRLAAGLSQAALAERAGLSENAVAALERGRRTRPHPDTVALLADALSLEPQDRHLLFAVLQNGAAPAPPLTPNSPPEPELIERGREETDIEQLLQGGARLISLLGPGGVGKTSLARELARVLRSAYVDGTAFVDLSTVRDPALVVSAMAQALQAAGIIASAPDTMPGLVRLLRERQVLLVLDNFEQVVAAASLVTELVAGCPRVAVLVTTRVALRVRGERQYLLTPLAVPPTTDLPVAELACYGAVQLFVARARAVDPSFALDTGNAGAVAGICCRLDGLPLAIELAAARVRLLPPAALERRLERRLATLTHGPRDLPPRQQTLRAALDWSFDMLSGEERQLLARLSMFAGSFDLDAAEAVCNAGGAVDLLDGLQVLLESSLLVESAGGEDMRFRLLETIREYAREHLEVAGELSTLEALHAGYFAGRLGMLADATWKNRDRSGFWQDQRGWLDTREREHDNLRAALRWARDTSNIATGINLSAGMWRFWLLRGHLSEGISWLEVFIPPSAGVDPVVRAEAVRGAAVISNQRGDGAGAERWSRLALDLYRSLDNAQGVADSLNTLGNLAREAGEFEQARARYEESLAGYRSINDAIGVAVCLNNLGTAARMQGDLARATSLYEESLELRRRAEDAGGIAYTLNNLGDLALAGADGSVARRRYGEALALSRELGDRPNQARALVGLGDAERAGGNGAAAAELYVEAIKMSTLAGDRARMAAAARGLLHLVPPALHPEDAARFFAALNGAVTATGGTVPADLAEQAEALRTILGDGVSARLAEEGRRLTLPHAAAVLRSLIAPQTN